MEKKEAKKIRPTQNSWRAIRKALSMQDLACEAFFAYVAAVAEVGN